MKLYMISQCPYVQRVLIGLKVRQIGPDLVQQETIDLANPPRQMLSINPNGSVPTLEFGPNDGFNESLIINEFLDTIAAPGPKLYGNTPAQVAKTKCLLEHINGAFLQPIVQAVYVRGNELAFRKGKVALPKAYAHFEEFLKNTEGPYFGGTHLNGIDAALAPFIVRFLLAYEVRSDLPLPAAGSRAAAYFNTLVNHRMVQETSAPDLINVVKRYLFPEASVVAVQNASRATLSDFSQQLALLNSNISDTKSKTKSVQVPVWKAGQDAKGPHLEARFVFSDVQDAVAAVQTIAQIQETTDHHTSLVFRDYQTLELTVCTHEPKWGVSEKDLALAAVLSEKLLQGS